MSNAQACYICKKKYDDIDRLEKHLQKCEKRNGDAFSVASVQSRFSKAPTLKSMSDISDIEKNSKNNIASFLMSSGNPQQQETTHLVALLNDATKKIAKLKRGDPQQKKELELLKIKLAEESQKEQNYKNIIDNLNNSILNLTSQMQQQNTREQQQISAIKNEKECLELNMKNLIDEYNIKIEELHRQRAEDKKQLEAEKDRLDKQNKSLFMQEKNNLGERFAEVQKTYEGKIRELTENYNKEIKALRENSNISIETIRKEKDAENAQISLQMQTQIEILKNKIHVLEQTAIEQLKHRENVLQKGFENRLLSTLAEQDKNFKNEITKERERGDNFAKQLGEKIDIITKLERDMARYEENMRRMGKATKEMNISFIENLNRQIEANQKLVEDRDKKIRDIENELAKQQRDYLGKLNIFQLQKANEQKYYIEEVEKLKKTMQDEEIKRTLDVSNTQKHINTLNDERSSLLKEINICRDEIRKKDEEIRYLNKQRDEIQASHDKQLLFLKDNSQDNMSEIKKKYLVAEENNAILEKRISEYENSINLKLTEIEEKQNNINSLINTIEDQKAKYNKNIIELETRLRNKDLEFLKLKESNSKMCEIFELENKQKNKEIDDLKKKLKQHEEVFLLNKPENQGERERILSEKLLIETEKYNRIIQDLASSNSKIEELEKKYSLSIELEKKFEKLKSMSENLAKENIRLMKEITILKKQN